MDEELDKNTGEEVELDPVLDEEDFQDTDSYDEEDSGQDDFAETEDGEDSQDDEDGKNTGSGENESKKTDNKEDKSSSDDADSPSTKKPLTREENAANAARRRREELEAKLKEEHNKTVISVLGGVNPFTGKEMTDAHDVEVYERMQRIKQAGGDPVADYASTLAEEKRKAEKAAKETNEADFSMWAKKDSTEFKAAHPDVDISALMKNENFLTIATPLLEKRVPMISIYKLYQQTQANIDSVNQKAKAKVKEAVASHLANEQASAGSLKANGDNTNALYTREQLSKMSQAEIDKNWDKVLRSYEALGK